MYPNEFIDELNNLGIFDITFTGCRLVERPGQLCESLTTKPVHIAKVTVELELGSAGGVYFIFGAQDVQMDLRRKRFIAGIDEDGKLKIGGRGDVKQIEAKVTVIE